MRGARPIRDRSNVEDLIKAVILGIVEGLTEFLPVSSTGHLIIASNVLDFQALGGTFEIFIQIGAVLAVVWFYRAELIRQARTVTTDPAVRNLWLTIVIAAAPAGVIGIALRGWIKATLFTPVVVALALIVGGIAFIVIERRPRASEAETESHEALTLRQAILIGAAQVLALIPGVSRSGATILGGLAVGLSRPAATAFSFFLAIPVLGGAALVELAASLDEISGDALGLLAVGTVVSMIFAFLSVGWLLRYVSRNTFTPFGWYRIAAGVVVLFLFAVPGQVKAAGLETLTPGPSPSRRGEADVLSADYSALDPSPPSPLSHKGRGGTAAIGGLYSSLSTHHSALPASAGSLVEVPAADGLILRGTLYAPHGDAPAVMLIHQLYTTQSSWAFLVEPLTEAGFNVLTIDLRGYGRTRGRINWQAALTDVQTWARWLDDQPGIQSVSMLGSSMGSVLAVEGCYLYDPCPRAVALSPAMNYYSVSIEDALAGDLPVMIAYADRDRYPARDMDEIVEIAGDDLTLFTYSGRTHGIDLFALDETLGASVVSFLKGEAVAQPAESVETGG
ncbi:MAG: undecaprenyl-diphosphate phosphatase [Anaerolineae bacterium]|nr:undecaprenyl-diphosphate phosphatase [Anaerolineae bacterium]